MSRKVLSVSSKDEKSKTGCVTIGVRLGVLGAQGKAAGIILMATFLMLNVTKATTKEHRTAEA